MEKQSPLKERPLPQAGQSGRELLWDYVDGEMFVIVGTPLVFSLLMIFQLGVSLFGNPNPIFLVLLVVASFAYSIYRLKYKFKKEVTRRRQGIDGEVTVGHELEELRIDGYIPFHDIPSAAKDGHKTNIDHVLVGKKGIFTIDTKTLSKYQGDKLHYENGSFWLSRMRIDNSLKQSLAEGHWLQVELSKRLGRDVPVYAVLLFPGLSVEQDATTAAHSRGVLLLSSRAIGPYIKKYYSNELSDESVAVVARELEKINRE